MRNRLMVLLVWLCWVVICGLLLMSLTSCGEAPARRAVDCRYTEQQRIVHEGQRQGINPATGEVDWITYTYEEIVPERYELKWQAGRQDGAWVYEWRTCTQDEYDAFREGRADDFLELPRVGD